MLQFCYKCYFHPFKFTEMVSDTFVICKQIKRIRAKKIIDAKKQNPPRYIAFDVFSSMHFHAADIFFDVT